MPTLRVVNPLRMTLGYTEQMSNNIRRQDPHTLHHELCGTVPDAHWRHCDCSRKQKAKLEQANPVYRRAARLRLICDVVHQMMNRKTVIGVSLMALVLILAVLVGGALREVRCGSCNSTCLRRTAVQVPEGGAGLIVETLFGVSSAPANAYVCQRCIEGLEDRVIAEMKRRQKESAQQPSPPYSAPAAREPHR